MKKEQKSPFNHSMVIVERKLFKGFDILMIEINNRLTINYEGKLMHSNFNVCGFMAVNISNSDLFLISI